MLHSPGRLECGPGIGAAHGSLRFPRLERAHEALDRVIAMGEPEPLDQILVNALGIAAELHLVLDPWAVLFAGRAGFLKGPSR
jgi:hypothetical protein